MQPLVIQVGHYYSNGAYGRAWGVRMVTALDPGPGGAVTFRGVAGACRRKTATIALEEFTAWAKYEVALNENSWQRIRDGQMAG